jgi:glycosyltransferase involved in cell wall biosynthesis
MLPTEETYMTLQTARLLVVPSICLEGFPLVLREAFAFGVPVAASRIGAFEELVAARKLGRTFEPGDVQDMLRTVSAMWADQAALKEMAESARSEFESRYTAAAGLDRLLWIYDRAIEHRRFASGFSHECGSCTG